VWPDESDESDELESIIGTDFEMLSQNRKTANAATRKYEKALFEENHFGATRIRKVNLHSSQYFSVEQLVSFSVAENVPGQWTGELLANLVLDRSSADHLKQSIF
jgi:hypothetical protein